MEVYYRNPFNDSSLNLPKQSESTEIHIKSYQQRGNFILRQELKSYTPECNAKCGIIFNSILMLLFICSGIPILVSSNQSEEYSFKYTNWYHFNLIHNTSK